MVCLSFRFIKLRTSTNTTVSLRRVFAFLGVLKVEPRVPWSASALVRQLATGENHLVADPAVLVTPVRAVLAGVQRRRWGRGWRWRHLPTGAHFH